MNGAPLPRFEGEGEGYGLRSIGCIAKVRIAFLQLALSDLTLSTDGFQAPSSVDSMKPELP